MTLATASDSGAPHLQACLPQFVSQSVFVNLLQKADAERVGNGKCTADDLPGNSIVELFICVHQRSSAVDTFLRPEAQPLADL